MDFFPNGQLTTVELQISNIRQISADSKIFTFALPSPEHQLSLRPGQHIALSAFIATASNPSGKQIKRKYTPTSKITQKSSFDIPIKVYYPTSTYPGGVLTTYLDTLPIGSKISAIGPIGKFVYEGNGTCLYKKEGKRLNFKRFGFIAGGSGITPCFQYIQYIIDHQEEGIELSLIYANKTEEDIWLRDELVRYRDSGKVRVYFTVDAWNEQWSEGKGHVNEEMIRAHLVAPGSESCVFFCGPSPMNRMLRDLLPRLGYENYTKF